MEGSFAARSDGDASVFPINIETIGVWEVLCIGMVEEAERGSDVTSYW